MYGNGLGISAVIVNCYSLKHMNITGIIIKTAEAQYQKGGVRLDTRGQFLPSQGPKSHGPLLGSLLPAIILTSCK